MRGLLEDVTVSKDDIAIHHDFETNETTISIRGNAKYGFTNLWAAGNAGDPESLSGKYVIVTFDASQFEFALALDMSRSMNRRPAGWSVTRLDALKEAIRTIAQTVDDVSKTNPGIVTLALVPYSNVVNVADTSGLYRTAAKERYVRMLTGAEYHTQTSRDTEGHWVDTFHHYGTGDDMGPLASRSLPDFLIASDWYLHRPGMEDVSDQVPTLGTWDFEGSDFWNGCVMARWGAYWDPDARPAIWDPADPDNWPAKTTVAGWEPGSTAIPGLPLHLSDAPPSTSDPNTRFTAYSWPDARIAGFADQTLNGVMRMTIQPGHSPLWRWQGMSENHWHLRSMDRGGSLLCPEAFIVPLTDDITALRAADNFDAVRPHSETNFSQTFLHLGIVWGLRALSPLWRDVWKAKSVNGDNLPRTPCLDGETTEGCSQFAEKAIVIVSDGANVFGITRRGRNFGYQDVTQPITSNERWNHGRCDAPFSNVNNVEFRAAWSAEDPATFANSFDVDPYGLFTPTGMSTVLDGFQASHPVVSGLNPLNPADMAVIGLYRANWENALKDMTPWQLFRGYDETSPTKSTNAIDVLVDPTNAFGFIGRPVQNSHYCRPMTPLSAYGRAEELVRVGDSPPVSDVAPFSDPTWLPVYPTLDLQAPMTERLDDWFREACDLAGRRGVRIYAIYIGDDQAPWEQQAIALLEECVDLGYGGNPAAEEVYTAPTAQELKDAIEDIIDIRRTLRFIGP